MKLKHKLAALAGVLALSAAPALAAGGNGHSHNPSNTPNGKAFGKFCKGELKKHVKGTKGTPFSQCVTAMAKLAHGNTKSPRVACKAESKKHVKGMKGTPFSVCVSGGAKLLKVHSSSVPPNQGTSHMPTTPSGPPTTTPVGPPSTTPNGQPSATPNGPPSSTPPDNQGTAHKPSTPGPNASMPAKAKAYGKLCQGESKKHVKGTPGTPFSKCVTDMAKLANGQAKSPRAACKNESKKHVKGEKGTPFSRCVSGAAKLLKSQHS